ncbi:fibronectin type III domain-containing protein [Pseudonocardia sp.]|uniref:fibronectin type III domain-containing protein n=1 Tax=Pseudonocardia sp. TaxID=60912 RepID=UPI0031FC21DA
MPSQSKARDPRGRRRLNRRVVTALVTGVATAGAVGAIVADAAPPAFPDNIVVFPDRDFITIEGYQNHIGETGLVQITRDGNVIGSAKGVVEEGDVAFEVNHPGGYCWGAGTGLDVTPDIRPGDKATISFNGIEAGDTTAANTYVTEDMTLTGSPTKNTVVVHGYAGPGVNQAQMEQRIIQPDLVDTEVGKRDVRAVPGPLTPAPKGAYSSSLTFEGDQFTATYVFQDPANALIASKADLGERAMSWQVEDADGNRQGLTIAEFGEAGGPGMGGCPLGPGDAAAPQPGTATVQRSTDKTSLSVTWTPTDPVPTAAPVTGYTVEAIKQTASSTGEKELVGKRTGASATHVNLAGLSATQGYDVEVRSMADSKMSAPFTVQVPAPSALGDVTAPTLTVSPANTAAINTASTITLSSEAGSDIYYTIDGTSAVEGGLPSDTAKHYLEPIALSGQVTLHAVVFDRAGNSDTFVGVYKPATDTIPAPAAVSAITGSAGQASVTLSWAAPEAGVIGYGVQAYVKNAAGARVASGALVTTTQKTVTIGSLNPGTEYYFTVKAKNGSGYGPESTDQGPFVPTKLTDSVSIATAKWKSGDFRITGSGSAVGALLEVHAGTPTGLILARGQVEPPVAPATLGTYDIRVRASNAPASNPGKIYVVSENGGVAGPFTVTNG